MSFEELGLRPELLPTLKELGFTNPTPVQAEAIPVALKDEQDLFVVARTGTGKTAAFALPLLTFVEASSKPQALILSPTRELANQITQELNRFSKSLKDIQVMSIFGGTSIERQIRQLRRGVSIIVATPGRLLDLARRGEIHPEHIRYLVLDEADEMLNMGFKEELDDILKLLPDQKRTWLFSATMAKGVKRIASRFMNNALEIRLSDASQLDETTQSVIEHIAYNVPRGKKYESLLRIIDATDDLYAMVFCRTRLETQSVVDRLVADGVEAGALHGDLSQALRDQAMGRFKRKTTQILVATDIASRGIDIDELTHVLHYDLPENSEAYIHRSGRTGRAGRHGLSALMVEPRDQRRAESLARSVRLHIKLKPLPKPHEVIKRRLRSWIQDLLQTDVPAQLPEWLVELGEEVEQIQSLDKEQLLLLACSQAISLTLNRERLLDLDEQRERSRRDRGRNDRGRDDRGRNDRARNDRDRDDRGRNDRARNDRDRDDRGRNDRARNDRDRDDRGRNDRGRNDRGRNDREQVDSKSHTPEKSASSNHVASAVSQKENGQAKASWAVIEVNQGADTGFSERSLKQKLEGSGLQGAQVGRLQVLEQTSIFEVQEVRVEQALKSFKGFKIEGKKVRARRRS
jgi:ATP-dependent RNA helicase DeaD